MPSPPSPRTPRTPSSLCDLISCSRSNMIRRAPKSSPSVRSWRQAGPTRAAHSPRPALRRWQLQHQWRQCPFFFLGLRRSISPRQQPRQEEARPRSRGSFIQLYRPTTGQCTGWRMDSWPEPMDGHGSGLANVILCPSCRCARPSSRNPGKSGLLRRPESTTEWCPYHCSLG
jgi:hypothetical protein